jgi:hypothetical protein
VRAILIWLTLPILVWIWVNPVDPVVRAYVSLAYVVFLLLAAPVWCGAEIGQASIAETMPLD